MTVNRLCIIGTGLIGCSFALALKQAGFEGTIVGQARQLKTLDDALSIGAIDVATTEYATAVAGADLVMLTVPMMAMRTVLTQIKNHLGQDTIITDGGSVKTSFIDDAAEVLGSLRHVVPGHPIAGRELSGPLAADPDLYRDRRVLLTPTDETLPEATAVVETLWRLTGANVEQLDAGHHDRVLAATSHLPHMLAFGLVDMLATRQESEEIFRYAAGGFRDFSRIASGDPTMWRDICLTNRAEVGIALNELIENLQRLDAMVAASDGDALGAVFGRAKKARDKYTA